MYGCLLSTPIYGMTFLMNKIRCNQINMHEEIFIEHECTHIKTHNMQELEICMSYECVQLDLFKASKHNNIPFCASSLEVLRGPWLS